MNRIFTRVITNTVTRVLVTLALAIIFGVWSQFSHALQDKDKGNCTRQNPNATIFVSGVSFATCKAHWMAVYNAQVPPNPTVANAPWASLAISGSFPMGGMKVVSGINTTYTWGRQYDGICEETEEKNGDFECVEKPPLDCGIGYHEVEGECVPFAGEECANPIGYLGTELLCGDDAAECAATGGYYGTINDVPVCVPPADDVPSCAPGTFVYVADGSSTFVCKTPEPQPPVDPPVEGDPPKEPGNGPGDPDDPDNQGTGPTKTGPCDASDTDYLKCQGLIENISETVDDNIKNLNIKTGESVLNKFDKAVTDALGSGESIPVASSTKTFMNSLVNSFSSSGCNDVTFNGLLGPGSNEPVVISCTSTAPFRSIAGWCIYFYTCTLLWAMLTRPVQVQS